MHSTTESPAPSARAAALAQRIQKKLKAMRGQRLRQVALGELVESNPPDEIVAALMLIISEIQQGGPIACMIAADTLAIALTQPEWLPYETRGALYSAAKSSGFQALANLFFAHSPQSPEALAISSGLDPERPLVPKGKPLTLGERKTIARTHDRQQLLAILRDPHPVVIGVVLENPHLTEADVITLASRRPSAAESLEHIAARERWRTRYSVRKALVQNPYTPCLLAMQLTTNLRRSDLLALAQDPTLSQPLRAHARALLTAPTADPVSTTLLR